MSPSAQKAKAVELTPYHPFRTAEDRERYLASLAPRELRWPVPSDNRMVDTSWARTFVRISGPADAPPLVLLHGMATNSIGRAWRK